MGLETAYSRKNIDEYKERIKKARAAKRAARHGEFLSLQQSYRSHLAANSQTTNTKEDMKKMIECNAVLSDVTISQHVALCQELEAARLEAIDAKNEAMMERDALLDEASFMSQQLLQVEAERDQFQQEATEAMRAAEAALEEVHRVKAEAATLRKLLSDNSISIEVPPSWGDTSQDTSNLAGALQTKPSQGASLSRNPLPTTAKNTSPTTAPSARENRSQEASPASPGMEIPDQGASPSKEQPNQGTSPTASDRASSNPRGRARRATSPARAARIKAERSISPSRGPLIERGLSKQERTYRESVTLTLARTPGAHPERA